jgi:hypothetical protein
VDIRTTQLKTQAPNGTFIENNKEEDEDASP